MLDHREDRLLVEVADTGTTPVSALRLERGRGIAGMRERAVAMGGQLELRMPELDGIEATCQVAANDRLEDVRIIILTTFEMDEYVFKSLRPGASGFLLKDTEPAELLLAIRIIAGGDSLLAPRVTRRLIAAFTSRNPARHHPPDLDILTDREREVMTLVAAGLTNDEIADELVISPATAKTHVSRAMTKLHARDRAQLVVFAYESGLVTPS